jgi:hypothetical protein
VRHLRDPRLALATLSLLLGAAGVLLFGTVHALAIVPIWWRLAGGLPFAVAAALPVTWLYHTLVRAGRWPPAAGAGLRFGALCWAAELPATAFVNLMRWASAPGPRPGWVDPVSLLVAAATGAALFGPLGRTRRAALAGALACGALLAMAGGVVPIVNGRRAAALWAGLLAVEACAGVLLAIGYRVLARAPVHQADRVPTS